MAIYRDIPLSIVTSAFRTRFWAKVLKTDTCWLWQGDTDGGRGYGRVWRGDRSTHNRRRYLAHRIAWLLTHDFLDPQDNVRDAVQKGRWPDVRGSRNRSAKLTDDDVRRLRSLREAAVPNTVLATQFGIRPETVSRIIHKHNWGHL